jgi:hypothetical protein
MQRIDYRTVFSEVYQPPERDAVVRVSVPPRRCLVLDGEGPIDAPAFAQAIGALRTMARALRRRVKTGPMALDFRVMPPEVEVRQGDWTVMILQPPVVDASLLTSEQQLRATRPLLTRVALRVFPASTALQTLHTRPLHQVDHALERLQGYADRHGHRLADGYLAIDLGDARQPAFSQERMVIRRTLA